MRELNDDGFRAACRASLHERESNVKLLVYICIVIN